MKNAVLAFEDGSVYRGKAFGATSTVVGEVVFNTSMMGYQELLTDPSNYMNILTMTFVEIGCYGINDSDNESNGIKAAGLVVAQDCEVPSNWRCTTTLDDFLKKHNTPAISGVDTRAITKKIVEKGSLKACLSTEEISDEEAIEKAKNWNGIAGTDYAKDVTCKKSYHLEADSNLFELGGVHIHNKPRKTELFKCAAIDFGAKQSILNSLAYSGFDVTVFPADVTAEEIEKFAPDCVFLSNGAGDPSALKYAVDAVAELVKKYPTFGVGFGNALIALAFGGKIVKLKSGHHGGNYPVRNVDTGKVRITSQNHAFAVDAESLKETDIRVSEVNLADGSVEGLKSDKLPVFSIQYYPEDVPGPLAETYAFDDFYELVKQTLGK